MAVDINTSPRTLFVAMTRGTEDGARVELFRSMPPQAGTPPQWTAQSFQGRIVTDRDQWAPSMAFNQRGAEGQLGIAWYTTADDPNANVEVSLRGAFSAHDGNEPVWALEALAHAQQPGVVPWIQAALLFPQLGIAPTGIGFLTSWEDGRNTFAGGNATAEAAFVEVQ